MNYNYHTHTYRSHHALGTPEEYVLRAIDGGIKYMGFSDHAPFVCANGKESGFRVPTAEAAAYRDEIKALAYKYKDKIDIKVGFEMEYYPDDFERMFDFVKKSGAQYLILGQHFLWDESQDSVYCSTFTDDLEMLKMYVERVVSGIKSKKFTYVAHPDCLVYTADEEIYREEMRKICVASRKCKIPLEINFLGIRAGRHYPNEAFLSVAGEERAPVTFGFDSHDTEAAFDGESLKKAEELVEKYNLNYIGKPKLILINK